VIAAAALPVMPPFEPISMLRLRGLTLLSSAELASSDELLHQAIVVSSNLEAAAAGLGDADAVALHADALMVHTAGIRAAIAGLSFPPHHDIPHYCCKWTAMPRQHCFGTLQAYVQSWPDLVALRPTCLAVSGLRL